MTFSLLKEEVRFMFIHLDQYTVFNIEKKETKEVAELKVVKRKMGREKKN
jgi:hypothetical protein